MELVWYWDMMEDGERERVPVEGHYQPGRRV